eukprot:7822398-Alexandrium_andersonii.AAC.1
MQRLNLSSRDRSESSLHRRTEASAQKARDAFCRRRPTMAESRPSSEIMAPSISKVLTRGINKGGGCSPGPS